MQRIMVKAWASNVIVVRNVADQPGDGYNIPPINTCGTAGREPEPTYPLGLEIHRRGVFGTHRLDRSSVRSRLKVIMPSR